ncbi:MAG: hypothetical protein FK734_14235 [Asgard group archaeon]|nr:hypothetical protein [Asgard group archaeon]
MSLPGFSKTLVFTGIPISYTMVYNGRFRYDLHELRNVFSDSMSFYVRHNFEGIDTLGDYWKQEVIKFKTDIIENGKMLFLTFNFLIRRNNHVIFQTFIGGNHIQDYAISNTTDSIKEIPIPVLVQGDGSTSYEVFCRIASYGLDLFFKDITKEVL